MKMEWSRHHQAESSMRADPQKNLMYHQDRPSVLIPDRWPGQVFRRVSLIARARDSRKNCRRD